MREALTSELMDAMLTARAVLWSACCRQHKLVVKFVSRNKPAGASWPFRASVRWQLSFISAIAEAPKLGVIIPTMRNEGVFHVGDLGTSAADAAEGAHVKDCRLLGRINGWTTDT